MSAKWKTIAASLMLQTVTLLPQNCIASFLKSFTGYLWPMQAEKKKAAQGDDGHGNPEIDRLRKEVQDTKEINKKLRELLQVTSEDNI